MIKCHQVCALTKLVYSSVCDKTLLTIWGPTSSYARQCVPLHEVQRRAWLDTLYRYAFCHFISFLYLNKCHVQEAHAIYYVLYELLGA